MKKRNRRIDRQKFVFSFVLILFLLISTGYSYLHQELFVTGKAIASKDFWDIHFISDSISSNIENLTCIGENCSTVVNEATLDDEDDLKINFSVNFKNVGDYYEFTTNVINVGTIDGMLDEIVNKGIITSDIDKYDINLSYDDGTIANTNDILEKNGDLLTLKVRIVAKELINKTSEFSFKLDYIRATDEGKQVTTYPSYKIMRLNHVGETISINDDNHTDELRFIGSNPNNYVMFNGNQKWRIVGIFNGKLKLVSDPLPYYYSYDISPKSINGGNGITQWGESVHSSDNSKYLGADLMRLLNPGYDDAYDIDCVSTNKICDNETDYSNIKINNSLYWNAAIGNCYRGGSGFGQYEWSSGVSSCNFTNVGLKDSDSKRMISDTTWYTAALGPVHGKNHYISDDSYLDFYASNLYNWERSNMVADACVTENCNDDVVRTTTWQGKVGLLYPSDYAYATAGNTNGVTRDVCLNKSMLYDTMKNDNDETIETIENTWKDENYSDCILNDWLYFSDDESWTMSFLPFNWSNYSILLFKKQIFKSLYASHTYGIVRPVVYLDPNVKFLKSGDGSSLNPFILRLD